MMWWMAYKVFPVHHEWVLPWLIWWIPYMYDAEMVREQLRFINGK
jgi:hypothetical protein